MSKIESITQTISIGKILMPPFPSTRHITEADFEDESDGWTGEEKIDGANVGITFLNGEVIIRNRDHILRKGYTKDTAAKKQFLPLWNWAYKNKKNFEVLADRFDQAVTVYGEWCLALHGVVYDELIDYFVGFDIYLPEEREFLPPSTVRNALASCGFATSTVLFNGKLDENKLTSLVNQKSRYSSMDLVEGIYLKKVVDNQIVDRAKYVRPDYEQGCNWNHSVITKQKLRK